MKAAGFCVLLLATHSVISDAVSASAPPLSATPISPTSAATPASLDSPAGGTLPRMPAGSPRKPPMPAPAPTNHFASQTPGGDCI